MEKFKTREQADQVLQMCSYFDSVMNDFKQVLFKYDLLEYGKDAFDTLNMLSDALAMEAFKGKLSTSANKFHYLFNNLFNNHNNGKK